MFFTVFATFFIGFLIEDANAFWPVPPTGFATMTHYDLPLDTIAACGCTAESTHYPTVAISQLAFGSTSQYGPACGTCYQLTLINTFLSNPPFFPTNPPSITVKVTDQCPPISAWCNATATQPNKAGHYINFDLAFPNPAGAIPSNFFPSNVSEYGYSDFGVWNISYSSVSCDGWAGVHDAAALGSVTTLGDSVCCPGIVTSNNTCPSFSENNKTPPPDTGTTQPVAIPTLSFPGKVAIAVIVTTIGAFVLALASYYSYLLWCSRGSVGGGQMHMKQYSTSTAK